MVRHHGHRIKPEDKHVSAGSIIEQFLIGGTMVMLISYLSSHVSTKVAALIYALPITYIPLVLYVRGHAEEQGCPAVLAEYAGQNVASMLLFLLFCLATYMLVKAHDNKAGAKAGADSKVVVISGGTLALCILGGLVFMAVPAAFYYYWVCAGTCTDGEFQQDKTPCYFGAP